VEGYKAIDASRIIGIDIVPKKLELGMFEFVVVNMFNINANALKVNYMQFLILCMPYLPLKLNVGVAQ